MGKENGAVTSGPLADIEQAMARFRHAWSPAGMRERVLWDLRVMEGNLLSAGREEDAHFYREEIDRISGEAVGQDPG